MHTSSDVWVSRMVTGWGRTVITPCPEVGGTVQRGGWHGAASSGCMACRGSPTLVNVRKTAAIVVAAVVSRTGFEPALPP